MYMTTVALEPVNVFIVYPDVEVIDMYLDELRL